MKKNIITKNNMLLIIMLSIIALIVCSIFVIISNPLRKSNEEIKEAVLSIIPLGTNIDDAIELIEGENWTVRSIVDNGVGFDDDNKPSEPGMNDVRVLGEKSIRVHMGDYRSPFVTSVVAFFYFDDEARLIGVAIRKDVDSL